MRANKQTNKQCQNPIEPHRVHFQFSARLHTTTYLVGCGSEEPKAWEVNCLTRGLKMGLQAIPLLQDLGSNKIISSPRPHFFKRSRRGEGGAGGSGGSINQRATRKSAIQLQIHRDSSHAPPTACNATPAQPLRRPPRFLSSSRPPRPSFATRFSCARCWGYHPLASNFQTVFSH